MKYDPYTLELGGLMREIINLTIDGVQVEVPKGTTILEAARKINVEIPTICFHPNLTANGLCRICSVDGGYDRQLAACVTNCENNMVINTCTNEVIRSRKTVLELLGSTVDLEDAPEITMMMVQ